MTAKTKNRLLTIAAVVSAAVGVLGLVRPTARVLNRHCVTSECITVDSFAVFQAGEALVRQRDSLNLREQLQQIHGDLTVVDSGMALVVRDCRRRGGC